MTPVERAQVDEARMANEIGRLESQLAVLRQRHAKVRAYIEMAEVYESENSVGEAARLRGGISGAAVRAAVEAIKERGQPIHTKELIEILARQGIQINGSNPIANLSGFLSRSDELRNSRASGWGLADWTSEEPPPEPPVSPIVEQQEVPPEKAASHSSRASYVSRRGRDLDDEIPF